MQFADAFKKFIPLSFTAGREEDNKVTVADASDKNDIRHRDKEVPEVQHDQPVSEGELIHKRHRHPVPRIEGFVDVGVTPDGKNLCFHGLLVPGKDREDKLRNRYILLDQYSPQWFTDLCWEIMNSDSKIPVRVRVTSIIGDNRCYVRPCTRDVKQVMNERGRLREELMGYSVDLSECNSKEAVYEFLYRTVAESKNLKIVQWNTNDFTALAVNRSGVIFRISGAVRVEEELNSIQKGTTTLEAEIDKHITVYRTYRI